MPSQYLTPFLEFGVYWYFGLCSLVDILSKLVTFITLHDADHDLSTNLLLLGLDTSLKACLSGWVGGPGRAATKPFMDLAFELPTEFNQLLSSTASRNSFFLDNRDYFAAVCTITSSH